MPCVHKRVYPPPVQWLTPCWPYEYPLSSATYSVASLPCPLLALLDAVTADRQQCQTEECENFDDRVNKDQAPALIRPIWYSGYVKPEPVVSHGHRKADEGIRDCLNQSGGIIVGNVSVDLDEPMMEPFDRSRTGWVEGCVGYFPGVQGEVGQRRRQGPGIGMPPSSVDAFHKDLNGNLPLHWSAALAVSGQRHLF